MRKESVDLTEPIKLNLKLTPNPKLSYLLSMIYAWYDEAHRNTSNEDSKSAEGQSSINSQQEEKAHNPSITYKLDSKFLNCFNPDIDPEGDELQKEEQEIKQLEIIAQKVVLEQEGLGQVKKEDSKFPTKTPDDSFDEARSDDGSKIDSL